MYTLLLKGGTVIDPAQGIHQVLDVAIRDGKIARLSKALAVGQAERIIDAGGKLVTPGLVDLHTHVYWGGTAAGIKPDPISCVSGVTTFVDAGSAGAGNFLGFKEHVVDCSRARILAFLNIAYPGLTATICDPDRFVFLGETFDIRAAMPGPAVEMGRAFPDLICGIKVRLSLEASGDHGVGPLLLALQAAEALGKPVMAHIGTPPPSLREVVSLLREGDILTHVFRGEPNSPLDRFGELLPELAQARTRGVVMDIGHGGGSFSWTVAKRMLEQGFYPDVVSSDIHRGLLPKTGSWSGMPAHNQPTTMSKLLSLGMGLNEVIRASTINPARAIGCADEIGSLREGSDADVAVFELEEGTFEYADSFDGKTVGGKRLIPLLTILGGEVLAKEDTT